MTMNCFCGMVDGRKAERHFQPGPLSGMLTIANFRHAAGRIWACAEPVSGFDEWSCAVVITTTPRRHRQFFLSGSFLQIKHFETWWSPLVLVHSFHTSGFQLYMCGEEIYYLYCLFLKFFYLLEWFILIMSSYLATIY